MKQGWAFSLSSLELCAETQFNLHTRKTVIADETVCLNGKIGRKYKSFDRPTDAADLILNSHSRHFHEVIFFNQPIRLFLDIDVPVVDGSTETKFLYNVNIILSRLSKYISPKSIAVYTSHGPSKLSMHIICTNAVFIGHANAPCNSIMGSFVRDQILYGLEDHGVDLGVYSASVKQLRTCFSSKRGTDRVKVPTVGFTPFEHSPFPAFSLLESFVTNHPPLDRCNILDDMDPERIPVREYQDVNLEPDLLKVIMDKVGDFATDPTPVNGVIKLRRIKPSFCPAHGRVHESEHPYLIINEEGPISRIMMFCRRENDHGFEIARVLKQVQHKMEVINPYSSSSRRKAALEMFRHRS